MAAEETPAGIEELGFGASGAQAPGSGSPDAGAADSGAGESLAESGADAAARAGDPADADAAARAGKAVGAGKQEAGLAARLRGRVDLPAYLIALAAFALYTGYSVHQWQHFSVPSWDLGIFTELAQRYANVQSPIVDIKGPDFNLLGDHFHPLLILLGPVFFFFPSGLALLVLQNALFALSAVPLMRFARKRLGSWQGIVLGVAYVLSFGLTEAVKSQFHEIAFAVPLIAYGLVAWMEGRRKAAAIMLGMLVFIKEDLGLTVMMLGLVELWMLWGERSRADAASGMGFAGSGSSALGADASGLGDSRMGAAGAGAPARSGNAGAHAASSGAGTASLPGSFPARTFDSLVAAARSKAATLPISLVIWGSVWFVLAIFVLLPVLNPHGGWDYTGNIGGGSTEAGEGFLAFLTNAFGPGEKLVTLLLLACIAGIVGLRSPYMWLMVPTLAWRFLGNVSSYWGWAWHYSAILMPIAVIALIDGVERLGGWAALRATWRRNLAAFAVLVSLATSLGMTWAGPMGTYLRGNQYELADSEISAAQGAIEAVGKTRNVVTDLRLLAYLVPDNRVFWEGSVADGFVDAVAVTPESQVMSDGLTPEEWAKNRFGGSWKTVYDVDGYTVVLREP